MYIYIHIYTYRCREELERVTPIIEQEIDNMIQEYTYIYIHIHTYTCREELERVTPIIEQELEIMIQNEAQEKKKLLNFRSSLQKQWNVEKGD